MGEHVLKIGLTDLDTMRIANSKGLVLELPISSLDRTAIEKHIKGDNEVTLDRIMQLGDLLQKLSTSDCCAIEFVMPADRA